MRYIMLLSILFLLTACGTAPGKLVITKTNFPEAVDVTKSREITFSFNVENQGEKNCTVQNIYSPDFWKVNNPGATGNANKVFEKSIGPGEEVVFDVPVHIWDSDSFKDHMKRFAFTLNILYDDDCPQSFATKEGLIWLYK